MTFFCICSLKVSLFFLFFICGLVKNSVIKTTPSIYDSIENILSKEYPGNNEKRICILQKFKENKIGDKFNPELMDDYVKLSKEIKNFVDDFKRDCEPKKDERKWFEIFFKFPASSVVSHVHGWEERSKKKY